MTDDRPFTVRDRRSFTADGERREAAPESDSQPAAPGPDRKPGPDGASQSRTSPGRGATPESATLAGLFGELAAAAAFHLGLAAPEGGEPPEIDLTAARHAISMLELLRDKTQGNRSMEEDKLLEQLLFDLRMAWMARARGAA